MGRRHLSAPDIPVLPSPPANAAEGSLYWDTTLGRLRIYRNNAWQDVGPSAGDGAVLTPPLTGLPIPQPPGLTDWVVLGLVGGTTPTTQATATNATIWVPFSVNAPVRITALAINVTTAAAGSANIGVYSANASGQPNTQLYLSGNLDTGTTGIKQATGLTIDLQPGLYWAILYTSANPTLRAVAQAAARGMTVSALGTTATTYWRTTGAPTNPAPTSGYATVGGNLPAIGVQYTLL